MINNQIIIIRIIKINSNNIYIINNDTNVNGNLKKNNGHNNFNNINNNDV